MYKDAETVIRQLEKETEDFYKKVDSSRRIDEEFAVEPPDKPDEPLTEEEIAQIDAFWGKYKFAYPNIDYKSFKTFKNRCGKFSVYHCPGAVRTQYFSKHFVDRNYSVAFQNKALFDYTFPSIRKPKTILRRANGMYLDENFAPLTLDEAVEKCCRHVHEVSDVLIKPSGAASSGGHGIIFLDKAMASPEFVKDAFTSKFGRGVFIVQEKLVQSKFMNELNSSSVNTVRITTLLHNGTIHPVAALIRVGKAGNGVDAFYSGGCILGINMETGKCNDWALASDHSRISVLPSGVDLKEKELYVPNFDKVKEEVTKAHYFNPYIKMISWDIAIDQDDMPTFIECNFGGMIQIHEAANGPLFGEFMEDLCDEYLLKRFFTKFATREFICKEYHDHVDIIEYIGKDGEVTIPGQLRGKPITLIEKGTFTGCKIEKVYIPEDVMKASRSALNGIKCEKYTGEAPVNAGRGSKKFGLFSKKN